MAARYNLLLTSTEFYNEKFIYVMQKLLQEKNYGDIYKNSYHLYCKDQLLANCVMDMGQESP